MRTGVNKMLLFKSDFIKDIAILLVVTILLGTLLSLVIGTLSDYYFGDAVNSLIGDYQGNDLLLIIDEKKKEETIEEIKDVIALKIPGSELKKGINLAGKSNLFINLASKYKRREVFMEFEDYFKDIKGVLTTSLMTEPRLTVDGLKNKSSQLLADKIQTLEHVAFTFPDGHSLEVLIEGAQFRTEVKDKIEALLADYQFLGVRFPIKEKVADLVELSAHLEGRIADEFGVDVYNVTENSSSSVGSLAKTMTEMKKFLSSYRAEVEVESFKDKAIEIGDELVIPAQDESIYLRVNRVNDKIATAVITTGDSRSIVGKTVYREGANKSLNAVGRLEVNNPRQDLSYLVTELNKLLPELQTIFTTADSLLVDIEEILDLLELLEGTTAKIERINHNLAGYQNDLAEVDSRALKADLLSLEESLGRLVFIVQRLEFLRDLILDSVGELRELQSRVAAAKKDLTTTSLYYNNLAELENNLARLETKVKDNTGEIIDYINRYNPLLTEIKGWQQRVEEFNALLANFDSPADGFSSELTTLREEDLIDRIKKIERPAATEELALLEEELAKLSRIDFAGITTELEYIKQSLPKLKDEEITASIDLLDHYLAGQAIPGAEISLLLGRAGLNIEEVKAEIRALIPKQISFYESQMGVIVPNLRSQIYQILSEVKIILTVLTAFICTALSLLFDHGLIIASLQEINERQSWYTHPALYYSLGIGILTLSSIFYLTDLKSPYLPWWGSPLVGAILGLIIYKEAAVINDFAESEFKAGEAFGFNYGEIMRQIIIPKAKPGLLKLLNQPKTYF